MKQLKLTLPHLCYEGFIEESYLLKLCADIHWEFCKIDNYESNEIYQSFIYLEHNIQLEKIKKNLTILSDVEFYKNYVVSNHLVNDQPLKLISVPVQFKNYKLKRIKTNNNENPDLSKFKYMKQLKFKVEFEDYYKTNQYRDYNAVGLLYFANYIRIENEYLGPAKYGRMSSFYQNVQPNNFILCQGNLNNFTMKYDEKIMFSSMRKVQSKTDQEGHLLEKQVLAQHSHT